MTPTDPKKLAKDPPEAHHSTQRHLEGAHERNGGFPWIYSVLKPVNFPFDVLDDWLRGSTFFFVFNPSVAVVSVSWRTGKTAVVKSPLFNPKTLKRGCPLWWNLEIGWQHRSEEVPNLYGDGHPTIQQHHPTASFWLTKIRRIWIRYKFAVSAICFFCKPHFGMIRRRSLAFSTAMSWLWCRNSPRAPSEPQRALAEDGCYASVKLAGAEIELVVYGKYDITI